MHFLHVGMVGGFGQHAGDHPALVGHFHALIDASLFKSRNHGGAFRSNLIPFQGPAP
jgi:hypothetical protein